MKTIELKAYKREGTGKNDTKHLRLDGKTPCVLYGKGENLHFWAYTVEFKPIVYTPETYLVKIKLADGSVREGIIKDMQFHPVNDVLQHVDFFEVSHDSPLTVQLPVQIVGTSEGQKKGGKLSMLLRRLKVRGMLASIPEYIPVNVESLDLGQSVRVRDVDVKEVELLNPAATPIAIITVPRGLRGKQAAE
jgi:large subunit ribosomal protein L25